MKSNKIVNCLKSYLVISIAFASINSYSQGHYAGSSYNPNDYFISPASGWVFSLYYSYSQMDYYNDAGEKADSDPSSCGVAASRRRATAVIVKTMI